MKKFKNKILSVLLFTFSILVVHDYMIADTNAQYESSYAQSEKILLDVTSKVHAQIHLSMDVPLDEVTQLPLEIKNNKVFDYKISSIAYIQSVLQRPPLS